MLTVFAHDSDVPHHDPGDGRDGAVYTDEDHGGEVESTVPDLRNVPREEQEPGSPTTLVTRRGILRPHTRYAPLSRLRGPALVVSHFGDGSLGAARGLSAWFGRRGRCDE